MSVTGLHYDWRAESAKEWSSLEEKAEQVRERLGIRVSRVVGEIHVEELGLLNPSEAHSLGKLLCRMAMRLTADQVNLQ